MTTRKQRLHVYISGDNARSLDALAGDPRLSKSAIVDEALQAWFAGRAGNLLDERFGIKLDRIGRRVERLESMAAHSAEAFGTFVQHHLTLFAHHPEFTPETVHLGQERYRIYVEAVGRRLARRTSSETSAFPPPVDPPVEDQDDRP